MTTVAVRQELEKALEILEAGGRIKGESGPPDNQMAKHCMGGAVDCARVYLGSRQAAIYLENLGGVTPAIEVLRQKALDLFGYERLAGHDPLVWPGSIAAFNDHPDTTDEDAILVFKHSIADCE
jgi:hypothetical protein